MKNFGLFAFALTVLVFTGCATTTKTLTNFDNGKETQLKVGQVFVVELPGNRATGFQWDFVQDDNAVVEAVGRPGFLPAPALIGGGGKQIFTFRATKTGEQDLKFRYFRVWENKLATLDTVVYKLVVAGGGG